MSNNVEIVEKIIRSSNDDSEFKKIHFDSSNIKNKNQNFENIIVNKPWGYEYLLYSSKEISIWILKILKNQKTSMHCHPNKKTSLVLLEGEANLYTLDETINLKSGNAVIIDKGAFHRTSSEFGKDIIVMEIETPTNKNDIVRYQDEYKRSNSGYETKESFSVAKNHDTLLNFNNIKNKPGTVGNCVIKVINSKSEKTESLNEKTLICPIILKNKNSKGEVAIGEIFEKNIIKEKDILYMDLEEFLVIQKKQSK